MRGIIGVGTMALATVAMAVPYGVMRASHHIDHHKDIPDNPGERLRLADAKRARKSEKLRRDFSNHTGE